MSPLEKQLVKELEACVADLFVGDSATEQLQLQATRKDFEGDLTLVVFPLLRLSKKSPEETAQLIGEKLKDNSDLLESFNVVKGFLNLVITPNYWISFLKEISSVPNFGYAAPLTTGKEMVEYSSPNTNKPLHLGHLRNNFLGNSVARILEATGKEVIKVQIINDRGIHICKSMLAWQKFGNGETPESSGLKGDKLVGKYYVKFDQEYKKEIEQLKNSGLEEEQAKKQAPLIIEAQEMLQKWEQGDAEVRALWSKMNQWVYNGFAATYQAMGVDFDKLYYESETYLLGKEQVIKHESSDLLYRKEDGSIWINLEAEGLDNKLLLRSDGTSVYITQDIGTAIVREEEFHCDHYYYVVGNEQDYHFNVLAIILQKMGYPWAKGIQHLSYGMVDLPSGKMKSREGTVVDADDLMEEMVENAKVTSEALGKLAEMNEEEQSALFKMIGLGALKYFILKVDPKKRMLFDPKESIDFNGNTGPFIQYAYARIQSILNKVPSSNMLDEFDARDTCQEDLETIKKIHEFPMILQEAAVEKSPAIIANYTYELVKTFNHFYQNTPPIVREENEAVKQVRLLICRKTGELIKNGMNLLGIEVPNQM